MRNDEIYQALRQEILTTELMPGAELREQELAQRFEVSKSPVREALQHLLHEGLVVVMPRQGYRVSPVSISDAHDLFGFRRVLELACAEEAARNGSKDQLAALDHYRVYEGDEQGFITYNRDFHQALAMCCGNDRMARTACDLIDEMDRLVRMSVSATRGRDPRKLVAEHVAIIDAVQAHDHRRTLRLLKSHIGAAEKRFLTALQWTGVQS